MLVSTIISDARKELLETSAQYWSDSELIRYINRGVADYVNKTRISEDDASLSLVQGQLSYPLPSNWSSARAIFLKIANDDGTYSWERVYPTNLEKVSQESRNFLNNTVDNQGKPTKYFLWNRQLWLNKAPSADHATELRLFFKSKPIPVGQATDTIDLEEDLNEAILAYVLWKAWMKEQEFERADDQRTTYDRYIAEGRKWVKKQSGDQRYRLDIDSPQSLDGNYHPFGPLAD